MADNDPNLSDAADYDLVPVDHVPQFADAPMATGGAVQDKNKTTKKEAAYRGGNAKKRCGICSMYVPPSSCTAVRGVISPWAVCKFYERKK